MRPLYPALLQLVHLSSPLRPPPKLRTHKAVAPKASTATHKFSRKATSAPPEYLSSSLPPHQQQGRDNEDDTTTTRQEHHDVTATTTQWRHDNNNSNDATMTKMTTATMQW